MEDGIRVINSIRVCLEKLDSDVYVYFGMINKDGYQSICDSLPRKAKDRAILVLATNGGDPNAGYRIARALLHTYGKGNFSILIPTSCKSAGTLMCIGASELVIADRGELGPLDIQVSKPDEMFQNSSGLDILQAVKYLESAALTSFRKALVDINRGSGVSTKTAASIADGLIASLYQPVVSQIDPVRLGEMQRAINIAQKYGERLNAYHENLLEGALQKLIWDYPVHEFVIDRAEAKELFSKVRSPCHEESIICDYLVANVGPYWQNQPVTFNLNHVIYGVLKRAVEASAAVATPVTSGEIDDQIGDDHGTDASGSHQEVSAGDEGAEAQPVAVGTTEEHETYSAA
ncbi:SDH family Clp fold serine proteinase [Microvirgula aerodenitrificans]|uniref:SDH family Clp fold serine proteinase n=1 Tax=Microvirgula aerodenitrificans TaxID=57480 RepID=UPI0006846D40|nr:hypothetical protein [Microvirgula aerodenitrificans]